MQVCAYGAYWRFVLSCADLLATTCPDESYTAFACAEGEERHGSRRTGGLLGLSEYLCLCELYRWVSAALYLISHITDTSLNRM